MRHKFEKSKLFLRLRMVFGTLLFCGWWGFLYPQLILPEGTYRITYEEKELTGEDLLKELESNEENTICIKSKLFSMLQELLWENDNE